MNNKTKYFAKQLKYDYKEHFTPGNCGCDIVMTEGAFTSQRLPITDFTTHT